MLVDFALPMDMQFEVDRGAGGGGGGAADAIEESSTVLMADLCDVTGLGCMENGSPPEDALGAIGAEKKVSQVTEGVNRGFVDYSGGVSVFQGDDTILS